MITPRGTKRAALCLLVLLARGAIAAPPGAAPAPEAPAAPAPDASPSGATPETAPAAEPAPMDPRAAEHKAAGDRAMDSLRYSDALEAYRAAFEIQPRPELLYNMGRALQAMGDFPGALEKLDAFTEQAPPELKARVPKLAELVAEVRSRVTRVTFTSNVDGARVLVRQKIVGTTPFQAPVLLNAGKASLEVTAEGRVPIHRALELPPGGELAVPLDLAPLSDRALLVVSSPVKGARVAVDGTPAGTVPTETVIRAGRHLIRVERDGYEPRTSSAVLVAGERKELSLPLAETPPVTARWWFWTSVGAVVAGGVVLTAALLTERSPDRGNIPPGKLATPLVTF